MVMEVYSREEEGEDWEVVDAERGEVAKELVVLVDVGRVSGIFFTDWDRLIRKGTGVDFCVCNVGRVVGREVMVSTFISSMATVEVVDSCLRFRGIGKEEPI